VTADARRIALVMGNSSYSNTSSLANTINDAKLMATALKSVGFEVTTVLDADLRTMKRAMLEFGRSLRTETEASLFYYAGHGVQVRGENYLLPTNVNVTSEDEVDLEAVNVNSFLQIMNSSESKINIVILDSCRNNPFSSSFRSATRGLAPVFAPKGTYIAYATAPGNVAYDGRGDNSYYTEALAQAIAIPGLEIAKVFRTVRRNVVEKTNEQQVPWESSSIIGDFYFKLSRDPDAKPKIVLSTPRKSVKDDLKTLYSDNPEKQKTALLSKPKQEESSSPKKQEVELTGASLTRAVQVELNRLGCDAGEPDGKWGSKSKAALRLYTDHTKRKVPSRTPSMALLTLLRGVGDGICPLISFGKYTWSDGAKYEGRLVDGIPNGYGTIIYTKKKRKGYIKRYMGYVTNNKLSGKATAYYSDGGRYEGNFRDNKRSGYGVYRWSNGNVYKGNWKNGKKHGNGTSIWKSGGKYRGKYRNGLENGYGVLVLRGRAHKGNWRNGCLKIRTGWAWASATKKSCHSR